MSKETTNNALILALILTCLVLYLYHDRVSKSWDFSYTTLSKVRSMHPELEEFSVEFPTGVYKIELSNGYKCRVNFTTPDVKGISAMINECYLKSQVDIEVIKHEGPGFH